MRVFLLLCLVAISRRLREVRKANRAMLRRAKEKAIEERDKARGGE